MELCALPVAAGSFPVNDLFNQLHICSHFKSSVAHLAVAMWPSNPHYPLPNTEAVTPQQLSRDKAESKQNYY